MASKKLYCVFSTLTCDNKYASHKPTDNGMVVEEATVLVKGGAGVMNDRIITPRGVATLVTEADVEILKRNPVFKMHEANGFVAIEEVARPPSEDDVENAAAAMASRDGSAPMVDADFKGTPDDPVPTTGAASRK